MTDVSDLRSTIIPRSDQINSDQLLGGPLIITIADVRAGTSAEQPVSIFYATDMARPYRPCLTMRKVLVHAWGPDGTKWVGRSIELYNDPSVKFGGEVVGGIRISRLSDIPKEIKVSLTATKGRKALHQIAPLVISDALTEVLAMIGAATDKDGLQKARAKARSALTNKADLDSAFSAYTKRVEALQEQAAAKTISPSDRPDTGAESRETEAPQRDAPKEHPQSRQEAAGEANDAPVRVTYAQIASALHAAKNKDELDVAASLIEALKDRKQRGELEGLYDERVQQLE